MSMDRTIRDQALRLAELDRSVIRHFMENNNHELAQAICDYVELKKEIRTWLLSFPAAHVQSKNARKIIRKISEGMKFPADKLINNLEKANDEEIKLELFTDEELREIAEDIYNPWFSYYDYVRNLLEIGSLILSVPVNENLKRFVNEAKNCYAFEQYNAMYSLCRTIIESGVKDICIKNKYLRKRKGNIFLIEEYKWSYLRNRVSSGELNKQLSDIYGRISTQIHGRRTVDKLEAQKVFQETLEIVHQLYSQNGFK